MTIAPEDSTLPGGGSYRDLPKVSLHDHLDGGLRPGTIVEIADEIGLELPAQGAEALGEWFRTSADSGSLVEYLKTFDVTIAVMQTEEHLARVAREFVEDLADDGVVYGEIRWAPEQHLTKGLSLDAAVEAVQSGIEEAVRGVEEAGGSIRVGQLVSAMRHLDRGTEIAELAVRHRDRGVVGFDIAGPEAIRGALLDGRALRLGHGVRIAEDIEIDSEEGEDVFVTLGTLAQWVKDRGIPLELSPSSNLQTGAIEAWGDTMVDHPFDLLYQLGFAVTVNTDNRLMSGTSISRELSLLTDAFAYDLDDHEAFQLNAAAAAFLPLEEREALADIISDGFARL
jgi:adenosine deaminase